MEGVFFIENTSEPLYIGLYHAIKKEIYANKLIADEKLPSIRHLSKAMNISRTTIENTYSQLIAEGYLYSKPQQGYYVMPLEMVLGSNIPIQKEVENQVVSDSKDMSPKNKIMEYQNLNIKGFDFVSEYVDPIHFNMSVWKKNINLVINEEEVELFRFSDPFGEPKLKKEIASYFTRVRGIHAKAENIIIGAGTQSLLRGLSLLLFDQGYTTLNIDNPGFNLAKDVFSQSGFDLRGIDLKQNVLDITKLSGEHKQILFTSPSFQFPHGEIMPVQTRHQLLNWASETNSFVIEDDYNNELRYLGRPVPSLQGMDMEDRVVYLGSFSTLLIPSIRVSFMVLPEKLANIYLEMFRNRVQSASKLEQLALANMLQSGDFAKHIRKLRKAYKLKNQKLAQLTKKHMSDIAKFEIPTAGVTAIIHLNKGVPKKAFSELCSKNNINIGLLSEYMIGKSSKTLEKKLVLNYRGISEIDMDVGLEKLKELICQLY